MTNFQQKSYETCKETGKHDPYTWKKEGIRNYLWKPADTGFKKDFKGVIINMFTELKKTVIKEVKGGMMTMLHQIGNMNKVIEITIKINRVVPRML